MKFLNIYLLHMAPWGLPIKSTKKMPFVDNIKFTVQVTFQGHVQRLLSGLLGTFFGTLRLFVVYINNLTNSEVAAS